MPDPEHVQGLASWIQAGGVVGFAGLVWWELRYQRLERASSNKEHSAILISIKETLSALLERDRTRSTNLKISTIDE